MQVGDVGGRADRLYCLPVETTSIDERARIAALVRQSALLEGRARAAEGLVRAGLNPEQSRSLAALRRLCTASESP